MNYEEFEARAKSAFDDCSEMKRMLWNIQTVVAAVPDMVRKNERLDRERAELKQKNAALKAELDDWKGNAEGFEPDAYMRLPLDADGVPIRIGDEVNVNDNVMTVLGYRLYDGEINLAVENKETSIKYTILPSDIHHRAPEPPDSWDKPEKDALKMTCDYAHAPRDEDGLTTCKGCRFQESRSCHGDMTCDVLKRAKKLAGIEEREGE